MRTTALRRGGPAPAAMRRAADVLWVLLRYAFAHLVIAAAERARSIQRLPGVARITHVPAPERLRDSFEELGGAFLKFGQMLALQPDILPIEYCNALFDLLDSVPPFPFADAERVFIEDLGQPPQEVFDAIEPVPIASASIGQVYLATMGRRKLAVKVQRPAARAQFTGDTRLMILAIACIERLRVRPLYWLIEPITEFVLWTEEELDYRCEARYMARLRRNAAANPYEHVPDVYWPCLTPRILVTEFLEGDTVLRYLRRRAAAGAAAEPGPRGFDPQVVARHIIDNFLGDVFQHGMFHADLHPANLMILPGNVVGYIDFGITGTISRYSRQNIVALTLAYTRGDLAAMCAAFFRVSAVDERSRVNRFRAGLELASRSWYVDGVKGKRLRKNFTLVMLDMLRLSRETGIFPARDVIKYIRSAIAIDGLITRLAPAFDVRRHLEAVCAQHMAGHLARSAAIYEAVATGAQSGVRMWRTGCSRAATILERLAHGELPVAIELAPPAGDARPRRRAVAAACLAAVGFAMAGLPQGDAGVALAELATVASVVAALARHRHGALRNATEV